MEFTTEFVMQFGWVLVVGSTLILGFAFALQACLRRRSAAERFSVWQIATVGLLFLPVCCALLPQSNLGWFASLNRAFVSQTTDGVRPASSGLIETPINTNTPTEIPGESESRTPLQSSTDNAEIQRDLGSDSSQSSAIRSNDSFTVLQNQSRESGSIASDYASNSPAWPSFAIERLGWILRWLQSQIWVLFFVWVLVSIYYLARTTWSCIWANKVRAQAVPLPAGQNL